MNQKRKTELQAEIAKLADTVLIDHEAEFSTHKPGDILDDGLEYIGRFGPYTTRGNGLARNKGPFKRAASARAR